jgi:hypothetical protein
MNEEMAIMPSTAAPSGLNATLLTQLLCPSSVARQLPMFKQPSAQQHAVAQASGAHLWSDLNLRS